MLFDGVRQALAEKSRVQVLQTVKANGENVQISYYERLDAWLIASKNVSLCARTREDIALYPENQIRFTYTRLIAQKWFDIVEEREKEEGAEAVRCLKKDLQGLTFVGEYCGNQKCQHLVKYQSLQIYFFAVVRHRSQQTCLPPERALDLLKRHKLATVAWKSLGVFDSWDALNETLGKVYLTTAMQSLDDGQEGSVLYFVKAMDQNQQEVLALCK